MLPNLDSNLLLGYFVKLGTNNNFISIQHESNNKKRFVHMNIYI